MEELPVTCPQEGSGALGGKTKGREWFLVSLSYTSGTEAGGVFLSGSSHLSSSKPESQGGLLMAMGGEA